MLSTHDAPWAILPTAFGVIHDTIAQRPIVARASRAGRTGLVHGAGDVVVRIRGTIVAREHDRPYGGETVSAEALATEIRLAAMTPNTPRIVLAIDSHGGSVAGITELADVIHDARARVPVVAVVEYMAVGVAYWIASQATEVVAAPSSLTGGIGIVTVHEDTSVAQRKAGHRVQVTHAGTYKAEGAFGQSLDRDAISARLTIVEEHYTRFVTDVARGRGVAPDAVRTGFGEGRVLTAERALTAGLVDRIGTMGAVLSA